MRTKRLTDLVEKSMPNPHRPRLPDDLEARLLDIDRKSAACYAQLEAVAGELEELELNIEHAAIPLPVPPDSDLSTMNHIDDARSAAHRRGKDDD